MAIKVPTSLEYKQVSKIGVDNLLAVLEFLAKIAKIFLAKGTNWFTKIMSLVSLGWSAFSFAEAIKKVPEELDDYITPEEQNQIAQKFDDLDLVSGDTEGAIKDGIKLAISIKNYLYKYFIKKEEK